MQALDLAGQHRVVDDVRRGVAGLSKGQATRLRITCALAHRPRIVLLDEPATGLDLVGRRRLLEAVLEVVQDEDRAVVISSHQLADIERIADRLLVLARGRVLAEGATPELVGEGQTLEEAMLGWEGGSAVGGAA